MRGSVGHPFDCAKIQSPSCHSSPVFVAWPGAAAYAEWGDQPTPAKCNVRENGVGETTAVDCYQTGIRPYGVYDLCGNTWEWRATESKPGRRELKGDSWTTPFEWGRA